MRPTSVERLLVSGALPFCRGRLPEDTALGAAARQARASVIDVFELLAHFGRDVAAEVGHWGCSPRRGAAVATKLTERVLVANGSVTVADDVAEPVHARANHLLDDVTR